LFNKFVVDIIVDGDCRGKPLVLDTYISFFGEVDPYKGIHLPTNSLFKGRVMVFRGARGSTVGSYIIYGLKKYGTNPLCMIVSKPDPILITGTVLAEIPLFIVKNYDVFIKNISENTIILHRKGEGWVEIIG